MKLTDYISQNQEKRVLILCSSYLEKQVVFERISSTIRDKHNHFLPHHFRPYWYDFKIKYNSNDIYIKTETQIKSGSMRGTYLDVVLVTTSSIKAIDPLIMMEISPTLRLGGEVFFYEP